MIDKLIKFRIFFIILLLSYCSIFLESPYHSNYYRGPSYLFYLLITTINILIYLIPTDKLIFIEKFVYAIIISVISIVSVGMVVEKIMGLIYGYDLNWDELKSPATLDNALFYFISNFSGIGIFKIWLKYKKPIYR